MEAQAQQPDKAPAPATPAKTPPPAKAEGPTDEEIVTSPAADAEDLDVSVEELQAKAEDRGVAINADVEKAQLVSNLRAADAKAGESGETDGSYDLMSLEELRKLAKKQGAELDEEFVKAHLITELRAAASSGGVTVNTLSGG